MMLAHELDGDERNPAVVLVHGITESRETWRPVIDALLTDHLVLAVDLRGHGHSDYAAPYDPQHYAQDVAETIGAAGVRSPLLVGHSLGGVVVTVVPAFCSDVVGVVNVDQPLELGAFQTAVKQLEPLLRGTPEQFDEAIGAVFASMVGPLPSDELERVGALRRAHQDVVLGTWAMLLERPAAELAATVPLLLEAAREVPYLSLHGIDPGPDYEGWLRAHLPDVQFEVWPEHGHYPHLVDRARFVARLAEFEAEVRGVTRPDGIRVERAGPIATIWLDRPAKRNAMSYAMWSGLGEACTELGRDAGVRVVVPRGAGGHFCAGADIGELLAERPADAPSFHHVNMTSEHALADLPKPTVAYVEGDCIGGGCALAIDCDLRIAVQGARFGITPAKLGVVYPAASHERVGRLLGPAAAKLLLFTGRLIDSDTALRIGLVSEVHVPGAGEAALDALCAELAERSLLSQSASKEMLAAIAATGSVPSELEQHWASVAAGAGDLREGVAAFAERRPPRFTWPS